jgi:hypothetical protein
MFKWLCYGNGALSSSSSSSSSFCSSVPAAHPVIQAAHVTAAALHVLLHVSRMCTCRFYAWRWLAQQMHCLHALSISAAATAACAQHHGSDGQYFFTAAVCAADSSHAAADGSFSSRRELCFTLEGDIFVRYQSYKVGRCAAPGQHKFMCQFVKIIYVDKHICK